MPIYSPLYAATEGLLGVNLDPSRGDYLLPPKAMFYEVIPVRSQASESKEGSSIAEASKEGVIETKLLNELQEGNEYEVVVTTRCGLCRYRVGDVVKVTGFRGEAPLVEVLYRQVCGLLLEVTFCFAEDLTPFRNDVLNRANS